jgi:hypothetical protein
MYNDSEKCWAILGLYEVQNYNKDFGRKFFNIIFYELRGN